MMMMNLVVAIRMVSEFSLLLPRESRAELAMESDSRVAIVSPGALAGELYSVYSFCLVRSLYSIESFYSIDSVHSVDSFYSFRAIYSLHSLAHRAFGPTLKDRPSVEQCRGCSRSRF